MAITPNDQVHQFDRNPGRGESLLHALAVPPATAVSAETRADTLSKNGYAGAESAGVTKRPASGSTYTVAGTNPGPKQNKHVDAYKDQNDTASIQGPGAPTGLTNGTLTATTAPLNWTAPVGGSYAPTGYRTQRSTRSGSAGAYVWSAWVNTTVQPAGTAVTATETGLTTGTTYRFRAFTKSGSRESTASNVLTVTLP